MNKFQKDFLKECKREFNIIEKELLFNAIYILPTNERDKYTGCRQMYIIGETEKEEKYLLTTQSDATAINPSKNPLEGLGIVIPENGIIRVFSKTSQKFKIRPDVDCYFEMVDK